MKKLSLSLLLLVSANAQFEISTSGISYLPGAIGDGTLHPLSERYSTTAAAQKVYPFVTSLSQSIDWAVIQLALNNSKGRRVELCASTNRIFVINTSIILGVYGSPPANTFVSYAYGWHLVGGGRNNSACEIKTATAIDAIVLNGRNIKLSQVRLNGNGVGHIGIVGYQFYGANIEDSMAYNFALDGISVNDTYNFTTTYNNLPNLSLPSPANVSTSPLDNNDSTWSRVESFGNGRDGIGYVGNFSLNAPFYADSIKWLDVAVFNNQRYGILIRGQNNRIDGGRFYSNCAYGIAVGEDTDDGGHFPPDQLWFGTVIISPWLESNGTNTNPTVCPTKPPTCSTCGIYFSKVGVGNYLIYGQTFLQTETYAVNAGTAKLNAPPSYTGGLQITDSARKGIWVRADIVTGSPSISAFVGNGCISSDTCPAPPDADLLLFPFGTTSKVRLKTNGSDRVIADNNGAWIPTLRVGNVDPGIQGSLSIEGDEYLQTVNNSHFSGINLVNATDTNKYLKIARLLPAGGFDGAYGLNAAVLQAGDETDAQPIYINFQGGDVVSGKYNYGIFATRVITGGTTITAPMDTVQTTVTVASTTNFPSYPFAAAIDLEGVVVTGAAGLTITITRCPGCASTHLNGASCFIYIPAISSHSSVSANPVDLVVQPQGTTSKLHLRTNGGDRLSINAAGDTEIFGNLKIDGTCTGCNATNPINVAAGGTGLATILDHGVLIGAGTSPINTVAGSGLYGQCFITQGVGSDPFFQPCNPSLSAQSNSTLNLTASYQDIPNATVTLNGIGRYLILASVEFNITIQASVFARINIGGSAYGALFTGGTNPGSASQVITMSQSWIYTNSSAGTVAKLQAEYTVAGSSGTSQILTDTTSITAIYLGL